MPLVCKFHPAFIGNKQDSILHIGKDLVKPLQGGPQFFFYLFALGDVDKDYGELHLPRLISHNNMYSPTERTELFLKSVQAFP